MTVEELIASLLALPNQQAEVRCWDVDSQDWSPLEAWFTNPAHDVIHLCTVNPEPDLEAVE